MNTIELNCAICGDSERFESDDLLVPIEAARVYSNIQTFVAKHKDHTKSVTTTIILPDGTSKTYGFNEELPHALSIKNFHIHLSKTTEQIKKILRG